MCQIVDSWEGWYFIIISQTGGRMVFWSFSYRLSIRKVSVRSFLFTTIRGLQPKGFLKNLTLSKVFANIWSKSWIKYAFFFKNYKTSFIRAPLVWIEWVLLLLVCVSLSSTCFLILIGLSKGYIQEKREYITPANPH